MLCQPVSTGQGKFSGSLRETENGGNPLLAVFVHSSIPRMVSICPADLERQTGHYLDDSDAALMLLAGAHTL
jgi:hypothetical protein